MNHTNHIKTYLNTEKTFFSEDTSGCLVCQEDHKKRLEEYKNHETYMEENTEELNCDKCGCVIGYTYANDLNGSRFYCLECK